MNNIFFNTVNKYANLEILFTEDNIPILAFVDEIKYKNNEITILLFIFKEIITPATIYYYKGNKYNIKEFTNYHSRNNKYHHTELILHSTNTNIPIDENNQNMLIYDPIISINNCSINKQDKIIYETKDYTIRTIKPYEVINNNIILNDDTITHIISIRYIANIDTINIISIGNKIYDVKKIINVDEKDEYLVFYCNIVNKKEMLI